MLMISKRSCFNFSRPAHEIRCQQSDQHISVYNTGKNLINSTSTPSSTPAHGSLHKKVPAGNCLYTQ
ncbi:hypothetical protein MMC2321_04197 [Chitinophaga sp. MM2321]